MKNYVNIFYKQANTLTFAISVKEQHCLHDEPREIKQFCQKLFKSRVTFYFLSSIPNQLSKLKVIELPLLSCP